MRALQEWASIQADRRPEATAVVFKGERLSYGSLEAASNRLARQLRASGCQRGDRVCLLIPKSPLAIIAIHAVLKAEAIFVPLDPASPAPRLAKMIDSCDDRWILAAAGGGATLGALFQKPGFGERHSVGWLDETAPPAGVEPAFTLADVAALSADGIASATDPDRPSHILFTSGSTGTPKGVVITHANVRHFVEWAVRQFGFSSSDRISGHPPLHFDLSTFDIFGAFAAGAELHLVPPEYGMLPHKMAELIRSHELTQWFSVPSALNYMAKAGVVRDRDFPSLRRLLWCGEVLPTPTLIHWMQRVPQAVFTNLYGPTEATIASSYYTVEQCPTSEEDVIPIGRACDGEELLVLDESLRSVRAGETGDLYIRGVGLSPGYWRDPDKTAAAFLSNPAADAPAGDRIYRTGDLATVDADGLVCFLGRADSQIKSRGYRIELGEIETALHAVGVLRECAVVGVATDGFDGTAICCAYAPEGGVTVTSASLRESIAAVLPNYMVPSRWMAFDALPTNANGKIDRPRLKELFAPQPQSAIAR